MSVVLIGFGVDVFVGDFFVDVLFLVFDIFSVEICFKIFCEGIGVLVSLFKFIDCRGVDLRCVGGVSFSSFFFGDVGFFIDVFDDFLIGDMFIGVFLLFFFNGDCVIEFVSCLKINVVFFSFDNCILMMFLCCSVIVVFMFKIVLFNDIGFSLFIFFSIILLFMIWNIVCCWFIVVLMNCMFMLCWWSMTNGVLWRILCVVSGVVLLLVLVMCFNCVMMDMWYL